MAINDEKQQQQQKRMFIGVVWNCAAELKLLLTALLFLCTLATILQFIPSRFSLSPADIRPCLSAAAAASNTSSSVSNPIITTNITHNSTSPLNDGGGASNTSSYVSNPIITTNITHNSTSQFNDGGAAAVLKRSFIPYGSAAYNFVLMSAYRGGPNTFAVIGLSSKPLHLYGKPTYQCRWVPRNASLSPISAPGYKILPDWGYGRVYTVVVVNCTFAAAAEGGSGGGHLFVDADADTILALDETPQEFANFTARSSARPKYDYLYCGSSLYGDLSPQRMREWLAYHVRLLGARAHFVIHDAGGVHEGLREVLKPWVEKGFVTVQDIREQEGYDGYYHNQFLIVNDCLHRYRFDAQWMFFFDVDEFIFVPKKSTIKSVLDSLSDFTQFTIEQMPMSNKICLSQDAPTVSRKWGFEKLVYRDVKRGVRKDRKYAVQPRNVFATGVHMSQNFVGKSTYRTEGRIKYFHYHGTIAERRETCRQFVNSTTVTVDGTPYVYDSTMREVAGIVKRFENKMIGSRLQRTQQ